MALKDLTVVALLGVSVLGAVLSALGIVSARAPFDRLHYLSAVVIAAPIPLTLGVIVQNGITAQASVQTLLFSAILLATNPVATHALGRAFRARADGELRAGSHDDVMS